MSALKELTVEAFVGNLIQKRYINETEMEKVTKMLENVRDKLSDKEKDFFLKTLIAQVDAPNSGLITQNRLNFANFENAIQEVGKVAEKRTKDRLERESKNQKNNGDNENLKEELLEKERKELEKEERIKENEEFMDGFFNDFLGLKGEKITAEEKREMAEWLYKAEELDSLEKKYRDDGESTKDALVHAMSDLGMTENDLESPEMRMAQVQIAGRKCMRLKEKGHSDEEVGKIVFADDSLSTRTIKREAKAAGLQESVDAIKMIALMTHKIIQERRVDNRESSVAQKKIDTRLDINQLKKKIEKREKMKESLREIDKKMKELATEKDDDSQTKEKELYKKITNEYLLTGKTVSSIFEKYKKKGLLGDMGFAEVLDGVIAEITPDLTERYDTSYIIKLKEHEESSRIEELTLQEYEKAQQQGNLIKNSTMRNKNPERIAELKKEQEKRAKELKNFKRHLMVKRKLRLKKEMTEPEELDTEEQPKTESLEQVLKNRDNVNRDRNAIIKLSKEQKISTNEAARQYFSEKPEALDSYTKEERSVLTGQGEKEKSVKKNSKLQYLNTLLISRNRKSMERISAELDALRSEVETAGERDLSAKKIVEIKLKIQKLEDKYQKIENNNKKLEKPKIEKTAEDILDKKVTELDGKAIFRRYLTTGKSAVEIYQEYIASKREISFDEILASIENEAKGFLPKDELKALIAIEKSAFQSMTKMELWKEQKAVAEKKKDSSEVSLCQNQIDEMQAVFNEGKLIRGSYKSRLGERSGITINVHPKSNANPEKRDTEIETENAKDGSDELSANNQGESPKLEIAEIETTPGIIPNVSAIAQKGNVTRPGIKSVFSKLFSLSKGKGENSKVESKSGETKADTSVDQEVMQ